MLFFNISSKPNQWKMCHIGQSFIEFMGHGTTEISVSTFPFNKQPVSVNTLKIKPITYTRRALISKSTFRQHLWTGTEHFITDYLKVCVHLFPRLFFFKAKQCRECAHGRWPLYSQIWTTHSCLPVSQLLDIVHLCERNV